MKWRFPARKLGTFAQRYLPRRKSFSDSALLNDFESSGCILILQGVQKHLTETPCICNYNFSKYEHHFYKLATHAYEFHHHNVYCFLILSSGTSIDRLKKINVFLNRKSDRPIKIINNFWHSLLRSKQDNSLQVSIKRKGAEYL